MNNMDKHNLRISIWCSLKPSQQQTLRLNGIHESSLELCPMEIFKRVTKSKILHKDMIKLKRGSLRLELAIA